MNLKIYLANGKTKEIKKKLETMGGTRKKNSFKE